MDLRPFLLALSALIGICAHHGVAQAKDNAPSGNCVSLPGNASGCCNDPNSTAVLDASLPDGWECECNAGFVGVPTPDGQWAECVPDIGGGGGGGPLPGPGGGGGGGGGGGQTPCDKCGTTYETCKENAVEFADDCAVEWAPEFAQDMCEAGFHIDGTRCVSPPGFKYSCVCLDGGGDWWGEPWQPDTTKKRCPKNDYYPNQPTISCRDMWFDDEDCLRKWLNGIPGTSKTTTSSVTLNLGDYGSIGAGEEATISINAKDGLRKACVETASTESLECLGERNGCEKQYCGK